MDSKAFLRMKNVHTPSPSKILNYSNVSNGAGAVASYFLMSPGPLPQAIISLGIAIVILSFVRGTILNFHLSFPEVKCLKCINFVMRILEDLEWIIMVMIPTFISFVAYNQTKGKYLFLDFQTLVVIVFYICRSIHRVYLRMNGSNNDATAAIR